MYIIVSTSEHYRGTIIGAECIIRAKTIGHEIHITRPILLFMLSKNIITTDEIIVTKSEERFFLYSDIFKNIISYDDMPINVPSHDILDITHLNSLFEERHNLSFDIDIEKQIPLLFGLRNNDIVIKSDLYNTYMSKIHYKNVEYLIQDRNYIVIHNRNVTYNGTINFHETLWLINNFLKYYPHMNIFVFSTLNLPLQHNNVFIVDRIDIYASLMNHSKCKMVISQFSGAGQLSQFCHNNHILYYETAYSVYRDCDSLSDIYAISNSPNTIYDYFDLKKITSANIYVVHTVTDVLNYLLDNFNDYLLDKHKSCDYVATNRILRI